MQINHIEFVGSFPSVTQCPKEGLPEYAFIGRSNVGKSSLINMIAGRKEIARISKQPGKTQSINYYRVDDRWFLVDLPGYGYAKVSKKMRNQWEQMIRTYLRQRAYLQCAFVLVDSNIPPQPIDIEFINWLGENRVPFVLAYTKVDRLKPVEAEANIAAIQTELKQYWNELPQQFVTSSLDKTGQTEILAFIEDVNEQYYNKLT